MNRIHSVATFVILGLAATAMGQNLISNPGFESGGTGWNLNTQSGSVAVGAATYPTGGAHTGTRYARVEVTTPAASAAENWHLQFQPPAWDATIGYTYEYKFWAKSDVERNIHVSVQAANYNYLTGSTFGLTTEWAEYTLPGYLAEEEGSNAVRFYVYVAEFAGIYSFDDFTLTGTPPAGISNGIETKRQALRFRQESGKLVLTLGGNLSENWKAELLDLRGVSLASATGRTDGTLNLALPKKNGTYLIRANTATHSWVRKVSIP